MLEQVGGPGPPRVPEAACAALRGRRSAAPADANADLELSCRLRIARARAGVRAQAPCRARKGPNPDFDPALQQALRLGVYSDLMRAPWLKSLGVSNRRGRGAKLSTRRGTYRHSVGFASGDRKTVTADSYFCVAGEPGHYVPYFFALTEQVTIDPTPDEAGRPRTILMQAIEAPPAPPQHVVFQIGDIDQSQLEAYDLADVNGDGATDLVLIDKRPSRPWFALRVCLFAPGAHECPLLEIDTRLEPPTPLVHARLEVDAGRIATSLTHWRGDETLASAQFRVRAGELGRVATP